MKCDKCKNEIDTRSNEAPSVMESRVFFKEDFNGPEPTIVIDNIEESKCT